MAGAADTPAFKFDVTVNEASITPGASATFLVEVLTNLSEFADHGAPVTPAAEAALPEPLAADGAPEEDDGAELVTVPALTLIPERRIAVQRSYSAFVSLRAALAALPVPGAASLPELPGKQLFTSADAKTLEKRRVAFLALLQHIGRHEGLACCAATSAFLSDVGKPDYDDVHASALQRMRDVLQLPAANWEVRYSKNDIEISIQRVEGSAIYLLRSTVRVPLPVAATHAHYTNTANWKRWAPDATFSEVERADPARTVLHVEYKIPVISNRDVCLYESQVPFDDLPSGVAPPDCRTAVAMSVAHPACPTRRGVVRARLLVAVTMFAADAGGTVITSIQHADPRGSIPASVVNACVARGKSQLKAMRRVMIELG